MQVCAFVYHISQLLDWRALRSHLEHGARVSHRLWNEVLVILIAVIVIVVIDIVLGIAVVIVCSRLLKELGSPLCVGGPMEAPAPKRPRASVFSREPFDLPSDMDTEELVALRDRLRKRLAMLEATLEKRGARGTTNKPSCEHVFVFHPTLAPRDNGSLDDGMCTLCGCSA